jgi:phage terminase large subunit
MTAFDWKNPDYAAVHAARAARLERIRANPHALEALKAHYAAHPAAFIGDWGVTSDPRAKARGLPIEMPFVLFDRQREMLDFILERMHNREPGLIEKSRDCGASWLVVSLAATLCLFGRGVVVGIGSSKEDKVDRSGDPDSLFWKARFFLSHLPPEFRGSWDESRNSAHMRITFPETRSAIVGEAGDAIGRGGRSTVYFIDEAAFLERPQLIEASLASNTECRIDISTPHGRANSFAVKRHSGRVQVFTFSWRDDPRKNDAWYAKQCELLDPVTRAQEIDLSYDASVEGILIPAEWIHAAIDAHKKLGIEPSGARLGALDVADEGKDRNAFAGRHGILLEHLASWTGQNSDIYKTSVRTLGICDQRGYAQFAYDADGLGAGVRGDAVDINGKRREAGKPEILAEPFRGSGAVFDPDGSMVEGRLNRDYFANLKAQSWWALRLRFQATYRAVAEGMPFHDPDAIISLSSELPELTALVTELSQPTYSLNATGKVLVDKVPDGAMSPNLADAVMIAYGVRPGSYFAARPTSTRHDPVASEAPQQADCIFAMLSYIENAAAVVYFAGNRPALAMHNVRPMFCLLDWDLHEFTTDAEAWMVSVAERLARLRIEHQSPLASRIYIADPSAQGYAALMGQLGLPVSPLAKDFPPVADRYNLARPYVVMGLTPIAPAALERTVTFRGSSRNFLRELLTLSEPPASNPLATAFATAVLAAFHGLPELPTSVAAPVVAPFAPPKRVPGVGLKPGEHTINGRRVVVEAVGEIYQDGSVLYPLAPGRYYIDDRCVVIPNPNAELRI